MQRRQNKYQMDQRSHIIDGANDKEGVKGKGKNKEDIVVTKNSFNALNVQEEEKETLTITDGKDAEVSREFENKTMKPQMSNPNPKENIINNVSIASLLKQGEEEVKHTKKEAVLNVEIKKKDEINKEKNMNHSLLGITSPRKNEGKNAAKASSPNPTAARIEEATRKEYTIE